jgi:GntR family transcriptional repressor for pyruvate dehydrogenase complex
MFREARQNRAFEDVIYQIQEAILDGNLKNGDKLPGERQLKGIFKVSRGTLREALRALEQKRLVQIKTGVGGGAIICQVDTAQMSESLDLLLRYQKISLRELAEFREIVEGIVAEKAARKAKKQHIRQLASFLESIENCMHAGELKWDEAVKEDNKFHLLIAQIAGNRIFESVLTTVYENINRYWDRFLPVDKRKRILERTHRDLCNILKAIQRKECHRAQTLAQGHVRRFNLVMEKAEKAKIAKTLVERP